MNLENLSAILKFFDPESGLDNLQVQYFLERAFSNAHIDKEKAFVEFNLISDVDEFNWKEFVRKLDLKEVFEEREDDEIKTYIGELLNEVVLPVPGSFNDNKEIYPPLPGASKAAAKSNRCK